MKLINTALIIVQAAIVFVICLMFFLIKTEHQPKNSEAIYITNSPALAGKSIAIK